MQQALELGVASACWGGGRGDFWSAHGQVVNIFGVLRNERERENSDREIVKERESQKVRASGRKLAHGEGVCGSLRMKRKGGKWERERETEMCM